MSERFPIRYRKIDWELHTEVVWNIHDGESLSRRELRSASFEMDRR